MLGAFGRLVFGMLRSRAALVAENEVLRQQLVAAKCRLRGKRVRWSPAQRWIMGALATSTVRAVVTLIRPETVLGGIDWGFGFSGDGGLGHAGDDQRTTGPWSAR